MCSTSLTLHTQYLELIKQREHQRPSEERVLFNVPQQGTNSASCWGARFEIGEWHIAHYI